MRIAVEGCCHGELDKIYETLEFLQKKDDVSVDLLLCCGDFQAVRNEGDMKCMAVPAKYRTMQTFYKYYSGEKKAPVLTIFIGGNHEASNHLQELPYGGWVAPNIYYLGYAGVVRYKGVRIGGLSGIYKSHDYRKGHHEFPPYDPNTMRSVYHVRNIEVFKLKQIQMPIDVFMSHDWPRGICFYGRTDELLRKKKFLRQDVESNSLGSPAAEEVLAHLQPSYWFSAHLHVKFAAVMQHPPKGSAAPRVTKFLSLDKCLPRREFLQIVDIPERPGSSDTLEYDPEWLAILKATNGLQQTTAYPWNPPENNGLHQRWDFSASEASMMEVMEALSGELSIPNNFSRSVPTFDPERPHPHTAPSCSTNNQTTELCAKLGLTDIYARAGEGGAAQDQDEEDDARSDGSTDEPSQYQTDTSGPSTSFNPDEITIEDEWEEDEEEEKKSGGGRRLVLPEPKLDSSPPPVKIPPTFHSTPAPADSEETSAHMMKRSSSEASCRGATPTIKRRNQIIYASAEDEEEDVS
ncbi:lariat debranching enzyme [Gouania willdenowi]|uniref:Lariat debranching enzyme C-terminal domain-containing protein n=1 Tax=Gouania willdenowi TaxID=441366 RepID=A0A8C5HQM6_GOUWI|nr:lariat debranching enzyme [Gouania willdenowi]XP_028291822.1 lariat debranching enzyme [Gouania willdenowi]